MQQRDASNLSRGRIRVVSLVQAETVTGPMKPLLMFSRTIQAPPNGCTAISLSAVTTVRAQRKASGTYNAFLQAAVDVGLAVDVIRERFRFDPAIVPQLANHLTAKEPQIIETHDFKSHFLVWLLKTTRTIPDKCWIAFHHGYTKSSARVRAYQQFDRLSLRKADQVVTVCTPFVHQLVEHGVNPRRIKILRNAIENRARTPRTDTLRLRQQLGLTPSDRVILSVGRLSVEKGHATLIAAHRLLERNFGCRDLRLILVGDGGEMQSLRAAAADLGERVIFAGHVNDPWPYYCMADVFALPSYSEGSPLALFEAMSAALPIVASAVGGIPETLSDRVSALLVSAGAVDQLTQALDCLLRDANLAKRLGQAARTVAEQFTPDQYTRERIAIYESLLRECHTRHSRPS